MFTISLPLLFFLIVSPSSSQPTEFFFSGFKHLIDPNNLTLADEAEIEKNGVLRLTNHTHFLQGHTFYSSPFRFKNSTDGRAFSGDGFAFIITPSKNLKASSGQYLGMLNAADPGNLSNHLVGIEFDTVQNLEFKDIDDNHVGIDINRLVSNASVAAGYYRQGSSTKQNLSLKSGKPIQAWIDYDSIDNVINVTIAPSSKRPTTPILSFHVDLSPFLNEFMYVGFSASTGQLASSHYVLGWSLKINGQAQTLDLSSLPSFSRPPKKHTALTVDWELEIGPQRYTYHELKQATDGFSDKTFLGQGGFGRVYKGTLKNSKPDVAVKRVSHESKQGLREFMSEISSLGRLRHRNLVQLLGWCRRRGDLLLVYDFMANGSLDKLLFDNPKTILNWDHRFRIVKGVAPGLLYLHEGYDQIVIHRDIKASNVLLDDQLDGRLGDFGLAKFYEHGLNPGTTRVVGTLGYLAPELFKTGKATTSSDVYAFGALLLEVACERRPVEHKALPEEMVLVDWVWEKYRQGRMVGGH
ncbi:hypothetical protein V6Z11_D11G399600 [Gossypium hirsutum]